MEKIYIDFIFPLCGNVIHLRKQWDLPFLPRVGESIDFHNLCNEVELHRAAQIMFLEDDRGDKSNLYDLFTDSNSFRVDFVNYCPNAIIQMQITMKRRNSNEIDKWEMILNDEVIDDITDPKIKSYLLDLQDIKYGNISIIQ